MSFVFQYAVCALVFLAIITIFFYKQRRVSSRGSSGFGALLVLGLSANFFSLAAMLIPVLIPDISITVVYILYYISMLGCYLCLPSLCYYLISYTRGDRPVGTFRTVMLFLPFVVLAVVTLMSEFSEYGIFWLDENSMLHRSALYPLMPACALIYILIAFATCRGNKEMLSERSRRSVKIYMLAVATAQVTEFFFPNYIVTGFTVSLVLYSIYNTIQMPSEYIDTRTNAYNSAALPRLVDNLYSAGRPFALMIFNMQAVDQVRRTFGDSVADGVLEAFAAHLHELYPQKNIIVMQRTTFVALGQVEPGEGDSITEAHELINRHWNVDGVDVEVAPHIAVTFGEYYSNTTELVNTLYYLLRTKKTWETETVFIADAQVKNEYLLSSMLEDRIEKLLDQSKMRVEYRPICLANGAIAALEASPYIDGKEYETITPRMFFETAERMGCIEKYTELLLRKTCSYAIAAKLIQKGIRYICVPLSMVLCMSETGAQTIKKVLNAFDMPHGFIILELRESSSFPLEDASVRKTIDDLSKEGFTMMLDSFGSGYTDIGKVLGLPVAGVKVSRKLVESTTTDRRQRALLAGINDIARRLGFYVICAGVDRPEHAALLNKMGILYRQGKLYSPHGYGFDD